MSKLPVVTFDRVTLCRNCIEIAHSDQCKGIRKDLGLTMISTVDYKYPGAYNSQVYAIITGCGELLLDETTMPS